MVANDPVGGSVSFVMRLALRRVPYFRIIYLLNKIISIPPPIGQLLTVLQSWRTLVNGGKFFKGFSCD